MRKGTTLIVLAALAAVPFGSIAGGSVDVSDTIAGLGTDLIVRGTEGAGAAVVEPPFGPDIDVPLETGAEGVLRGRIGGEYLQIAGTYGVSVTDGMETVATGSFEVLPDTVDEAMSTVEALQNEIFADGTDEAEVEVTLRDQYGNPLSGRIVELVAGRAEDTVTALDRSTDIQGVQRFTVRTRTPGTVALRVMDLMSGRLLEQGVQITAQSPYGMGGYETAYAPAPSYGSPYAAQTSFYGAQPSYGRQFFGQLGATSDIADHFEIIVSKTRMTVGGDAADIQIRAVDRAGMIVDAYTGTIEILSTDPNALLPGNGRLTFEPKWLGVRMCALCLQFRSPPEPGQSTHELFVQEIDARGNPTSVTGRVEVIMETGAGTVPGKGGITINSPIQDTTVNSQEITLEGTAPPLINLEVTGGAQDVQGDTDEQGRFSIPVQLDPRQTDHTLRIRDALNRYDSGNLRVHLDVTPPELGTVTFDPANPQEGAEVTVTLQGEPGVASAVMTIGGGGEITLTESASSSGTYTAVFTAPDAGAHAVKVTGTDAAGNTAQIQASLSVARPSLPKVGNVRVTAKTRQVTLAWDPVEDPDVNAYRIYVGTNPKDYNVPLDYPVGPGRATSVDVGNLQPGATYYFAVTASDGERESPEMSDEVSATVLGLRLEITPQDGALLIEWSSLQLDVPLSSFILEYGVEADTYSEQRSINGDLRAYALRDLLNEIRYYVRLTPVTTTGDVLEDLAAAGEGVPAGAGFRPGPAEPIPSDFRPAAPPVGSVPPGTTVPPIVNHGGAPELPENGLPRGVWWMAGMLTLVLGYLHWHRRRTLRMTLEFFRSMENRYHR